MSIGKWNQIARETSEFLDDNKIKEGKIFRVQSIICITEQVVENGQIL